MTCYTNEKLVGKVELEINGRQVELNNFVNNFIFETIVGMVKALRGVGEVETLTLKITKQK